MKKNTFPDNFPKSKIAELIEQAVKMGGGKVYSGTTSGIKINIYSQFFNEPLVYEFYSESTLSDFAKTFGTYLLVHTNLAYKIERIFSENSDAEGDILCLRI